jgi:hypothetical protein
MSATFDVLEVGSGEQIEQIRGQASEQLRCGALATSRSGSVQSRRELGAGRMLVEQVDVGELGPAARESGDNGPVDGLAQFDCGREIVVSDIDAAIQQPRLNRPIRQQPRVRQQFLAH